MKTKSIITASVIYTAWHIMSSITSVAAFTTPLLTTTPSKNTLPTTRTTFTRHHMFGGAGSPPLEDDDDDDAKEKEIEAAAKAMGFSVKEYKLVLRMQRNLADSVNGLRVSAGSDGVTVEMDGNSPPGHLDVQISEEGKALGKATLEAALVAALKDATEQAKKGQQEAVKKMNAEIAEEMKKMGMV